MTVPRDDAPLDSEAFARLGHERDRLKAIIDNGTAVIYLKDTSGRYLFINRRYEALFHITSQDILGKTDDQVFPPEFAARFREHDRKVLEANKPLEWEEIAPHDDGPHTYISLKFPLVDAGRVLGVCGISTDITAWKKIEEERNRFFTLTLDLLCVVDFAGNFVRLNPAWQNTLGWSLEEMQGQPYLDFIHPDDRAASAAEADKISRGATTISFENRYRCKDGSFKWLLWNAMPLVDQQLIYAAAHDITPRKEAEKQLADSAAQLRVAFAQAQQLASDLEKSATSEREAHHTLKKAQSQLVQTEKLVALGQMVGGMSHEINNPLAFVLNNLAVLQRDFEVLYDLFRMYQEAETVLESSHPELVQKIRAQSEAIDARYTLSNLTGIITRTTDGLKRIQRIVRDLRDFARMSDSDLLEVDLNSGIASTINLVRPRAGQKNVTLDFQPSPLPLVQCQSAKINQAVLNLITNAIDACKAGGLVQVRTVFPPPLPGRVPAVEVHVLDNGSGIPPSIRSKIFDPFFTTKPPGQGTGLGLSITYSILEEHGGTIEVDSTPSQGSHFTLRLPLKRPVPEFVSH